MKPFDVNLKMINLYLIRWNKRERRRFFQCGFSDWKFNYRPIQR